MSEIPQRPLRTARTPKFHHADLYTSNIKDQQIENYATLANPYKREITNTNLNKVNNMSTAALAKILTKFVNQINLKFKEVKKDLKKSQNNPKKQQIKIGAKKTSKQTNVEPQPIKKKAESSKKQQDSKNPSKSKELYRFQGNGTVQSQQPKPKTNISSQNINPNISNAHMNVLSGLQNHPYASHQLNQLQEIYPGIKQYMSAYSNDPQNFSNIVNLARQQQMMMSQNQFGLNQNAIPSNAAVEKPGNINPNGKSKTNIKAPPKQMSDGKLFKRSSYHVAIAYHIHLKKLQERNLDTSKIMNWDPTYYARKLRQEKTKDQEQDQIQNQNQNIPGENQQER